MNRFHKMRVSLTRLMRRCVLIGMVSVPSLAGAEVVPDLSRIIDVPQDEVRSAIAALDSCMKSQPDARASQFRGLIDEVASFAATEKRPDTRALLTDFSRQIVTQLAVDSGCTSLADLWDRRDPWLRKRPEVGIGLSRADVEAVERLEVLGQDLWQDTSGTSVEDRLLAYWDSLDMDEKPIVTLWFTRLSAWEPGVRAAWDQLDDASKILATQVTSDTEIPDAEYQEMIFGHDDISSWIGGTRFFSERSQEEFDQFESVTNLALAGYFGGDYYVTLEETRRMAIQTMNSITNSMVQYDLLFEMMDRSRQY